MKPPRMLVVPHFLDVPAAIWRPAMPQTDSARGRSVGEGICLLIYHCTLNWIICQDVYTRLLTELNQKDGNGRER